MLSCIEHEKSFTASGPGFLMAWLLLGKKQFSCNNPGIVEASELLLPDV